MLYTVIFLNADHDYDQMWFTNPKIGDIVRTNLLTDEELEHWTIRCIEPSTATIYLEKQ